MPYPRKRNAIRKFKKGRKPASKAWYQKRYSVGQLAAKAYKAAKYVASVVNVERKFFDVTNTGLSPSTVGSVYPLSQIGVGDTFNTREGNSIKALNEYIQLSAQLNTAAEATFLRCILFMDNENNGSTPAVADVLESVGYLSPINHVNGTRFTILRDCRIILTKTGNAKEYKIYKKLGSHIKWSGSNGTDTKEGHLYLLLLSDQATDTPSVNFLARMRFIDN